MGDMDETDWWFVSLCMHLSRALTYSPDAKEKFADASNAYTVLSNEEKREIYDREGEEVRR